MVNRAPTYSSSSQNPAARSRSAAKTVPSSSSIRTEAAEGTAPEKTAAEMMLGTADRGIIVANNA